MIKEVWYPKHLLINGIQHSKKGADPEWQVAAGDTETVHGSPYTLQLAFSAHTPEVLDVTPADILPAFVEKMEAWARRKVVNVVYFHNLKFDLQALLWDPKHRHWFAKPQRDFVIPLSDANERNRESWMKERADALDPVEEGEEPPAHKLYTTYLHCFTDKNWFAKLHLPSHRTVWVVDSRAFFPSSLESAANLVNSPYLKLDRPVDPRCEGMPPGEHAKECRCLGEANLRGDPAFEEYIRHDVLAQWHVGKAVANLHQEYDVKTCVSLPHLAARIFTRTFVPEDNPIPFPPRGVAKAAELSYHGGLNFMTVQPGWYRCHEIDINSAYTWAMTRMPPMGNGDWVEVESVPEDPDAWGFLQISGQANCQYGVIFGHDFSKVRGTFHDLWVTTRDVAQALKWNCARITRCRGYVWRPKPGPRPFKDYAEYFWAERKKYAKGTLESMVRKLLCNSLYGKTVQTTKFLRQMNVAHDGSTDITDIWRAGGIYNPVLGSWITSTVRADQLHEQAHRSEVTLNGKRFGALHGSTDAIKVMIDPRDLPNIGPELGEWALECSGPCLLLRPKLYVHEKEGMDVKTCTGKTCLTCHGKGCGKIAYHGFRGDVHQLLEAAELYLKGESFTYFIQHCWTTRQSLARTQAAVIPLNFERIPVVLRPGKPATNPGALARDIDAWVMPRKEIDPRIQGTREHPQGVVAG